MMIRNAEKNELEKVAKYAYQLNLNPIHKCKAFPTDYDNITNQFEKILNHPDDELLIKADGNDISGVLALLVEPGDKYIEAIGGVYATVNYEEVAKEFYDYLKTKYRGYQLDAAYPEDNKQAIDFMKSIGAELLGYDYELRINKSKYKPALVTDNITVLDEQHYKGFIELHDKFNPNVYWTGERLIKALDKFDIFIALENDQVIGAVVTSKLANTVEEIYFIEVAENKQRLGYGTALLNKAIQHTINNGTDELMIMVEKDNVATFHMFEKLGFKKTDTCLTYSVKLP